jgi:DNA-binding NarL/FixJ family response regulator
VVDDHRTFAEALGMAVGMQKGFTAQVAKSGREAIEIAGRERPDVVLMDLQMPGMGGLEAIRKIRELDPGAKVIVLSAHDDDLRKGQAVEAGASGYISKLTPLEDVPTMVRRLHSGEPLIDSHEKARLLRNLRRQRHQEATERQRANRLTPRQIEILQMMADGVAVADIARRLEVSPFTLRTHVQNILTRLSVHRKEEALVVAIRHGKISAGA